MEMVLNGPDDVVDDGKVLLAAGFDGCQHRFDEPASLFALCTETQLSPENGITQVTFGRVAWRLNTLHIQKRPQPFTMTVQPYNSRHIPSAAVP